MPAARARARGHPFLPQISGCRPAVGVSVLKVKAAVADGWTLPYGPTADNSSSSSKDTPKPPPVQTEHVDGDVIIDFVEGFRSEPALGPGPSS